MHLSRAFFQIIVDVLPFIQLATSVGNSNASASGRGQISLVGTVSPSTLVGILPCPLGDFLCLLGVLECTFLGPSRKRGPPKGYIDAIEARLHQTEAVLGIILSLAGGLDGSRGHGDPGAVSLIEDLCQVRDFNDQNFFHRLLITCAPIAGSTCTFHPPSSRGDTIWLQVEGQAVHCRPIETEAT